MIFQTEVLFWVTQSIQYVLLDGTFGCARLKNRYWLSAGKNLAGKNSEIFFKTIGYCFLFLLCFVLILGGNKVLREGTPSRKPG